MAKPLSGMESGQNMFRNKFKQGNQPDWSNCVVNIKDEQLKELVRQRKAGLQPALAVAFWERQTKESNEQFFYLKLEVESEEYKAKRIEKAESRDRDQSFPPTSPAPATAPAPAPAETSIVDDDIPF
jgi:hypothetical protein|tara:strand:- start:1805 stop:2185 length:381 start_codon:yes stop_codon:yes gene_type:complete